MAENQPTFFEKLERLGELVEQVDKTCRILRTGEAFRRELMPDDRGDENEGHNPGGSEP